jgi:hypothetical protein
MSLLDSYFIHSLKLGQHLASGWRASLISIVECCMRDVNLSWDMGISNQPV